MDSFILLSLPQSYVKLANKAVRENKLKVASALYFKAAESALEAYKKTHDNEEKEYLEDFIRNNIDLARYYNPAKKEATVSKGKSNSKKEIKDITAFDIPSKTFEDVAGMQSIKKDIEKKIIWPVTDPEDYRKYVGGGCRGVIMYGPPGCGKTLLAKAAAGEANKSGSSVKFYKVDQSDIKNMYVGNSEQNMRNLFENAAKNQPAIIFFDEVDSLAGTRGKDLSGHRKDLANEFKSDFDDITDKTILVIGATNHPWNIDSAFVRPGRFEELIFVPPPDLEARAKILEIHTKGREIDNEIDFNKLAGLTKGYSGADLEKICKDAGLLAYERKRNNSENSKINYSDFLKGIEKTKPSLKQWCAEVKDQMIDGRYPDKRVLRKGISEEFKVILDVVDQLEDIF
ncbi:MAG: ATP-binding protein [Candidatus Woesearchaeota archaeon]|nr:MAG: ATP-binding protein [Candidatus Woesearchaeota archaeon]